MGPVFVIICILEAFLVILLAFLLIKKAKAYRKISDNAERLAKGKLDVEDIMIHGGQGSDVAILASGVNALKNNLLTFIEATKGNVITLSDAIEVLSGSVEANQSGNEQIADSVTTVAQKTAEQMSLAESNTELITSSNAKIQEINTAIALIQDQLEDTVETSQKGMEDLHSYSSDMKAVTKNLSQVDETLKEFNQQIKQIAEIGEIIIDINNQLTLLAFNASIEAARVGEAGRGFSVVADQMNHLSQDTKKGMDSIHAILKEITESTGLINDNIHRCEDTFTQSKDTFQSLNNSLQTIGKQSMEINTNIKDIAQKTEVIAANAGDVMTRADRLFEATQMITDKTHEIAAASEETAAESSQINENVGALRGMLDSIQGLLEQFETSVVPSENAHDKTIKIAFLSMLDNDFWFGVRRGVFYAQKELKGKNALIDYFFVDTTIDRPAHEQVSEKIESCIKEAYDGIIFAGFLSGATEPLQKAIEKGIKVVAFNCDCSEEVKRLAVFSPDGKEAGEIAGKSMIKALEKEGEVAIIAGDLAIQVNSDRKAGFLKQLGSCRGIDIVEECEEKDDAKLIYQRATKLLDEHLNLNAIYITCGMQEMVAKAIEDRGRKGRVIVVGFDDNKVIFEYIQKGIIYSTIKQDPFGQGHDPVIWLYNHLVTGEPFPRENMGCKLSVIDRENVGTLLKA